MLWFKFYPGLKFFKPVWFLFSFVSDYDNQYKTMKTKDQTGLRNFKPKKNLNHNIYVRLYLLITWFSLFVTLYKQKLNVAERIIY